MKKIILFSIFIYILITATLTSLAFSLDQGKAEYWTNKYKIINTTNAKKVSKIFNRLVRAADKKNGVEPKLYIIDYTGTPWAQALQDGSIILTKNAVEFCYQDQNTIKNNDKGDSRIAFILGHELAHQLAGDFWHYAFFQAAMAEEDKNPKYKNILTELKGIVKDSENFITKEIRADQIGIIYASLAGYKTDLLLSNNENFFMEFAKALNIKTDGHHPTTRQRTAATITRLKEVSTKLPLFKLGVYAVSLGWNKEAIELLEAFKTTYPGREVYSNLGAAYLKNAIKEYIKSKGENSFPFKLSAAIDPFTRAENIPVRTRGINMGRYREMIDLAIENLQKAVNSDTLYLPAKNNLGAAYIIEGRYHDAIGLFNANLSHSSEEWETLNNRGIAYFYLGKELGTPLDKKAEKDFKRAFSLSSDSAIPIFNLSILYSKTGKTKDSQKAFNKYSRMTNSSSGFFDEFNGEGKQRESIKNIGFKTGKQVSYTRLANEKWLNIYDKNGILGYINQNKTTSLLIKNNIVRLIISKASYNKKTILKSYGEPDSKIITPMGEVWLFQAGFGFEIIEEMVTTEVLF